MDNDEVQLRRCLFGWLALYIEVGCKTPSSEDLFICLAEAPRGGLNKSGGYDAGWDQYYEKVRDRL